MKYFLYTSLFLLISISAVKAQQSITIAEDSVKFGNRYFPGFWLAIPEVNPETVKASWIKAIEKGTKSKVVTDKNEMSLFGANLSDIIKSSVNIMSKTDDQDTVTMLFVSVETTRDNFISSSSDEYSKLNKYLKKYAKDQYAIIAKKQLSAEETKLKDLNSELKTVRKSKERLEKGIQSSKVRISGQNDKIDGINKQLDILEIKIGNSSTVLSTMENQDTIKAKKSELKDLQKKKKSLLKDINSAQNSISKENSSIDENRKEIDSKDATQNELGDKISQQKQVVARFEQKLKTIQSY